MGMCNKELIFFEKKKCPMPLPPSKFRKIVIFSPFLDIFAFFSKKKFSIIIFIRKMLFGLSIPLILDQNEISEAKRILVMAKKVRKFRHISYIYPFKLKNSKLREKLKLGLILKVF